MINALFAVTAGALVVLSMSLNSALGQKIGVFRGTLVNYVVGLAGSLVVAAVWGWTPVGHAIPWWAWTGGLLGVVIVVVSNLVLPRLSVALSAVLIVAGQLGASLILDLAAGKPLKWQTWAGAALVVVGSVVTRWESQPKPPAD